ncbi:MAG: hypothetical protein JO287_16375 [Pseudonocardiales bacterium]|nr:hypothetical protein [Pseudonocardiales bacterium]
MPGQDCAGSDREDRYPAAARQQPGKAASHTRSAGVLADRGDLAAQHGILVP